MNRKNGGRDVSVRGETYEAVKDYCREHDISGGVGTVVTQWVEDHLDALESQPAPELDDDLAVEVKKHFTF